MSVYVYCVLSNEEIAKRDAKSGPVQLRPLDPPLRCGAICRSFGGLPEVMTVDELVHIFYEC